MSQPSTNTRLTSTTGTVLCYNPLWLTMENGQHTTTPIHGVSPMRNTLTPSQVGVHNWIGSLATNHITLNMSQPSTNTRSTSTIGMVHCCNQIWSTTVSGQCTTTLIHGVSLMLNTLTHSPVGVPSWVWLQVISHTMPNMNQLSISTKLLSTIGTEHCCNQQWLITENGQRTTTPIHGVKLMRSTLIPSAAGVHNWIG